jgi:hypothetical protein
MINRRNKLFKRAKCYCKEDISLIENYVEMINDTSEDMWCIHHKLELHNDYTNTTHDLELMNLYYNRPACELIFMKQKEHCKLHFIGKIKSEFGKLFFEMYGITQKDNLNLYKYEHTYYRRHGYLKGVK